MMKRLLFFLAIILFSPALLWARATDSSAALQRVAVTPQMSFVGDQSQCGVVKLTITAIGYSNVMLINAGPTVYVSNGSQVTVSYDANGRVQPVLVGLNNSVGRYGGFSLGFTSPATCPPVAQQPVTSATVYPNPASDQVAIQLNTISNPAEAGTKSTGSSSIVRLYDAYGKLCLEQRAAADQEVLSLNTTSLPAGVYVVSISGPNGATIRQRLKIER